MAQDRPDYQPISTPTLADFGEGQEAWFQSETKEVGANSSEDLINYVVPDDMELRICSGIVSCEAPRTQKFKFITTPAATWISPTSFIDPDGAWDYEEWAYDNDFDSYAESYIAPESWSSYLELLLNQQSINKIRFYSTYLAYSISAVDIDVYYEGAWHDVYEGVFADFEWDEKDIPAGAQLISKARIRFYNTSSEIAYAALFEFMFNTSGETPQEGIYFDTYAIIPYLPEAPYPVPAGATFTLRVYNDDEDAQYMSVNLAGFLQAKV